MLRRLVEFDFLSTFATSKQDAQMAELVDALVSNTSGFTSMPVRSRLWVQIKCYKSLIYSTFSFVGYKRGINKQQHPHF